MSAVKSVPPNQPSAKKSWGEAAKAYLDSRVIVMLFLGFSAGIPILLIFSSLSLWLREAGIDRSVVTMFSWAALGYSFKFIWAPLIDALPVPFLTKWLGRRRSWMVVSQLLIVLAIFLMATVNPVSEDVLIYMAGAAVLLGFSSATQDIVIDAYRIELAPPSMQSILSSIYVSGYRIGMIVAGAGALYLADYFGSTEAFYSYEAWRNTYYIMAGVMTLGILTTFASYEPTAEILQSNKQHRNLKVFLIYSALLLIPGLLFGVVYLLNMLINLALDTPVALIPQVALPSIKFYFLALVACAPLLLLYFIINQPKIINKAPLVAETREDYVRLVLLFVFAVVAFIAAYVLTGQLLPAFDGVFVSFVSETLHLLMSLAVALVAGFALVQAGLVNKQIAMATWIEPIVDFFRRYGMKALLLLALIGLYRISDIVAGVISNVFYQDMGFSKTDIANAVKLVGVIMAIAGGFLGGLLAQRFRIMHAMMIGAILACATNLLFVVLTYNPGSLPIMYMAVIFDNLAAGLASAVFIAFLSALTSIRFTAVQYAIFSSLMTLIPKVMGGYSGSIVDSMGYPFFFIFTFAIGIPILALIYFVDKHIVIGDNDDIYDNDDDNGAGAPSLTKANPNLADTKAPPRASE
ncbi:MFS transporter [Psychrobacter sp. Rd 27.2]|uniref:AmpG family muropeptide MFS transporter n=1 Tax=Psychrobacter sp. Rd 27.2 TaxID=1926479 RepID=UPI000946DB8B|nr:MFS transporter [Psychrobacter sp. Rd 27.2]MDN5733520.1 MFS transporter [Psychrobacter sp.]OLF39970.1 MFS transporter [Psychrobacter sp. Rd 27.2]